jgi:hypothetical protein
MISIEASTKQKLKSHFGGSKEILAEYKIKYTQMRPTVTSFFHSMRAYSSYLPANKKV